MVNSEFRVIKIIDDSSIVINAGINDGTKPQDLFEIYKKGVEVFDPKTNESLGTLDFVKAIITATTVLPKMSICKNSRTYNTLNIIAAAALTFPQKREPLNVDVEKISGGFEDIDKVITVGDSVRRIIT